MGGRQLFLNGDIMAQVRLDMFGVDAPTEEKPVVKFKDGWDEETTALLEEYFESRSFPTGRLRQKIEREEMTPLVFFKTYIKKMYQKDLKKARKEGDTETFNALIEERNVWVEEWEEMLKI